MLEFVEAQRNDSVVLAPKTPLKAHPVLSFPHSSVKANVAVVKNSDGGGWFPNYFISLHGELAVMKTQIFRPLLFCITCPNS